MIFKKVNLFFVVIFVATKLFAAEEVNINNHQLNYFAGNFDFSETLMFLVSTFGPNAYTEL